MEKPRYMNEQLATYYKELDMWLGPGGVEGWLFKRQARGRLRRELEKALEPTTVSPGERADSLFTLAVGEGGGEMRTVRVDCCSHRDDFVVGDAISPTRVRVEGNCPDCEDPAVVPELVAALERYTEYFTNAPVRREAWGRMVQDAQALLARVKGGAA